MCVSTCGWRSPWSSAAHRDSLTRGGVIICKRTITKGTPMLLVFEKRRNGNFHGGQSICDVRVSVGPYRTTSDIDCLSIRISGDVMKRAGWQVGDKCMPQYDTESSTWTLRRTTNVEKGYAVTQSKTARSSGCQVKLSLTKDMQIKLGMNRGEKHLCDLVEANGEKIVAVVKK